ncbi:MAG TPA: hypothetical protein PLP17_07230 [Oligoflexia bacterium]|nr:hypothetical protein [Oligoflexia bacterium]
MYTWTFNNGDHLRFYADVALLYGDFMREKGGKWYTIGHGRASSVVTDAYQGVDNLVARKDVLLARTANDLCADFNQQFPGYETSLSMRTPRLTGVYYPEGTAEELAEAFKAVAKKIKLSLVM